MIINLNDEIREFTYISNLYKCISNYNLMGHQIGRKVGDMLEILTMGAIYQTPELKSHLSTEDQLEGYTSARHKVEFVFFKNPVLKEGLFGAIECKCVGVEETKIKEKNTVTIKENETYKLELSGQWMEKPVFALIKLISCSKDSGIISLSNTSNENVQNINVTAGDNIKLVIDEQGNFLITTPHGNMQSEIPGLIRILKTVKFLKFGSGSCTFALFSCLTGPQTIEKAKQASLVAMDLRKKIDGHWGKEDIPPENKKMTFIHVISEFSHWEKKSRNVISICIDHNLVVPDIVLIKSFELFEQKFGTSNMLKFISKTQFNNNNEVRNTIYEILSFFENHIFYDMEDLQFVRFSYHNNSLCIIPI